MSGALKDKVIVVTGGAGLLGSAFARTIAERGGIAIVADISAERAFSLVASMPEALHGRLHAAELDITSKSSVDALIAQVHGTHGRLDGLVNNAYPRNAAYGRKLPDVTFADFSNNLSQHLGGYFLVAQRFAEFAREHGGGALVNMSSIYGFLPPRFEVYAETPMTMPVEYAAIKSGVLQLTRYFAKYYLRDAIRVNSVSPGGILDGQPRSFLDRYNALAGNKGMLDPRDIAGAVTFLLSDDARFITGQNLTVDDGFSL